MKADKRTCAHPYLTPLKYKLYEMQADVGILTNAEFRAKYPRSEQVCSRCGDTVILYASMDHYRMGDW